MRKIMKTALCMVIALAILAAPAAFVAAPAPGMVTAQAAAKKVVKKAKGYYSTEEATGYWANKKYKTKGLMRIYKFDKNHYMSKSSYNKMVKALKKKSYKALKKAIGKGKLAQPKKKGCNGGATEAIYKYGSIYVYVSGDKIEMIR